MTRHADNGTRRRSNLLVLVGLASFVLGLLAVYVVTRDDPADAAPSAAPGPVRVVVAADDVVAGTLGDDLLSAERYELREIAADELQPDMVQAPSQLSGMSVTARFAAGEVLRTSGLTQSGGSRADVPQGFEAVSVGVDFVAGGAATIVPGDSVNLYLVARGAGSSTAQLLGDGPGYETPRVELLLTNVQVLDVQRGQSPLQVSAASADPAGGAPPSQLIVMVAVDTVDAEKVIFAAATPGNSLYLSRVPVDDQGNPAPPAGPTEGVDAGNILAEEPEDAFARTGAP